MTSRQVRDSTYFLGRLENEHPAVFADYQAGKYPSVAGACRVAGLKKPRTNMHVLKNGWKKASAAERDEFVKWLGLPVSPPAAPSPAPPNLAAPTAGRVIAVDGHLEHWVINRIEVIKAKRGLASNNEVAFELGLSRLDSSIGNAIKSHYRLAASTLLKLERWLADNDSVR